MILETRIACIRWFRQTNTNTANSENALRTWIVGGGAVVPVFKVQVQMRGMRLTFIWVVVWLLIIYDPIFKVCLTGRECNDMV